MLSTRAKLNVLESVMCKKMLCNSKHLVTCHKVNSEFCFPETLNVPRGEAEGNIEVEGETKLTVSRGASH